MSFRIIRFWYVTAAATRRFLQFATTQPPVDHGGPEATTDAKQIEYDEWKDHGQVITSGNGHVDDVFKYQVQLQSNGKARRR